MKSYSTRNEAFTYVELIIVVAVVLVLLSLIRTFHFATARSPRIACINNLKQIGTAYRIWSNDHNDRYPALEPVTNGGWSDFLKKANEGYSCWINYAVMSNELGESTKVLVCPADERKPAGEFSNFTSNIHLSYLVGASADGTYPQSLLSGDRNLGAGTNADKDFGFSPDDGRGNDVSIATNSKSGPVCWSLRMHSGGDSAGAGNILMGDGSAQQVSSGSLRVNWQPHFEPTTNWPTGRIPLSPSIRVLFP